MERRQRIYVLVGVPASGKTTFAGEFKRPTRNTTVLSLHDIKKDLRSIDEATQFALLESRMISALEKGQDVLIDATSLTKKERENYITIGRGFNCYMIAVVFDTPIKICQKRNECRGYIISDDAYDKMLKKFECPTLEEGFDEIQHADGMEIELREHQYPVRKEIKIFNNNVQIGEAQVNLNDKVLEEFFIYEDYQNVGYGSAALEQILKTYDIKSLEVTGGNERAIHLYEKFGFKQSRIIMIEMRRD